MKTGLARFALLALCAFALLIGYLGYLQISGNFYPVSEGKVYRAAQIDGDKLAQWQREHGIATVLNLRGKAEGADWYAEERAAVEALGIEHVNFAMSEQQELSDTEVKALLDIMRRSRKPLLIHCKAGADRTGLASALYLAGIEMRTEAEAERHLSIRYGHIGLPWSKAWSMDVTWERMEPWLGFPDS